MQTSYYTKVLISFLPISLNIINVLGAQKNVW